MRILHLDEQRGWRGGEQQASYLMRGLAERGHAVFLSGRSGAPFLSRDHGFTPERRFPAPYLFEFDFWTASQLAGIVDRYKIDVVHAHTSHTHGIASIVRGMTGQAKVVVSRRVDFPPKDSFFSRAKYRRADHYIAISERIGDVLREFGVPPDKLSVVYSGIDLDRFDVEPLPREAIGVPDGVPLIGNVAALVGHKDHATLIRAMAAVVRERPDARLVIAGEGPLRTELERQITSCGIENYVTLLGYRDDIPRLLRALDIFVMSSKEEGLGTSVLDAMACGVPVVATAGGGIPEMVEDGNTGLLVPVGDADALARAVVQSIDQRELRERLVTNARAMVESRFTVDHMVAGNIAVYEQALETRRV